MNISYPAKITYNKADQRYLVKFYDFDEGFTEGETMDEALMNAGEVLTVTLEGRMDEKLKIPTPSKRKNAYWISPSARVQAALLVRFSKGDKTTATLARSLETSWPSAARLEDPRHWPTLKQIEKTAHVLGMQLVLSFKPLTRDE